MKEFLSKTHMTYYAGVLFTIRQKKTQRQENGNIELKDMSPVESGWRLFSVSKQQNAPT